MKNNNSDNLHSNINKKAKALICNYYEYYIMTVDTWTINALYTSI